VLERNQEELDRIRGSSVNISSLTHIELLPDPQIFSSGSICSL
jgi:hypothetical protein